MTTTTIGAHGRRIIAALERGQAMRRAGDGWRGGALAASDSLVAELVRHDLVRAAGDALALTDAGRGYTARTERPEGANRLLAERALAPEQPAEPPRAGRAKPARRSVTVNLAESPLGWLRARGLVSDRQHDAGERLRGDWTIAGLAPRVTMRWEPRVSSRTGPGLDPTEARIAARKRFDGAMAAAGSGLSGILWRVACDGEGIEAAEKALGWPRRAGKLVLLMALDRVAGFYGLG